MDPISSASDGGALASVPSKLSRPFQGRIRTGRASSLRRSTSSDLLSQYTLLWTFGVLELSADLDVDVVGAWRCKVERHVSLNPYERLESLNATGGQPDM